MKTGYIAFLCDINDFQMSRIVFMIFSLFIAADLYGGSIREDSLLLLKVADRVLQDYETVYIDKTAGMRYTSVEDVADRRNVRIGCKFMDWHYSTGILNMAMMEFSDFTGDPRYAGYAAAQVEYCLNTYLEFSLDDSGSAQDHRPFHFLRKYNELDHLGPEGAALIMLSGKFPDNAGKYEKYISTAAEHVANIQVRTEKGALARTWPIPNTVWADDLYMGVSFMAEYADRYADDSMLEDAVRQVILFNEYLWDARSALYWHGYYENMHRHAGSHWGRCNGWIMLAVVTLMDKVCKLGDPVLKERYLGYLMPLLVRQIDGIVQRQSPSGMWHQLLDKTDSYCESSATAIFVYCMARAVNNGWIDGTYASAALKGWDALCRTQISEKSELKNVCAGTGIGNDLPFYYSRPKADGEIHGTGLLLKAGMEIIRLKRNI